MVLLKTVRFNVAFDVPLPDNKYVFILFSHNRIRKYVEHESTKRALLYIFI